MSTELAFIQDFAIIMITAGAVMVIFRLLKQPPVLGYIIAGLITGPFMAPITLVKNVETIKLLGELGAVLLLFGVGLEFSWSKIRKMGGVSFIIAVIEIPAMVFIGYQMGNLMKLPPLDSLFLGAAISISSSAIIAKTLFDQGKEHLLSSRIAIGVLVVEDFAAVALIAILSGITHTGQMDLQGTTFLLAKLALFTLTILALGRLVVHHIISFVQGLGSKETLLLVCLGLCFGLALFSRLLGLSAAVGAFLMGTIIGDCRHSDEISELMRPLRDMFAALFFVTMGMLINMRNVQSFLLPALLLSFLFITGKLLINSIAAFLCGYSGKTPVRVGTTMTSMGEFSLFMGKVASDSGRTSAFIFPSIVATTTITTLMMPQLLRISDNLTDWTIKTAPSGIKKHVSLLSGWLEALRYSSSRPSGNTGGIRRNIILILSNLAISGVIFQASAWFTQYIEKLAALLSLSPVFMINLLGFATLALCMPSIIIIWRRIRILANLATTGIFSSQRALKHVKSPFLAVTFRESIGVMALIALAVPATSWVIKSFSLGWYPVLLVPTIFIAALGFMMRNSIERVRSQIEEAFSSTLDGDSTKKHKHMDGEDKSSNERY